MLIGKMQHVAGVSVQEKIQLELNLQSTNYLSWKAWRYNYNSYAWGMYRATVNMDFEIPPK